MAALHEAHLDEETLLCVVSDHGFLPVTTELRPNVLLRDAGLIETDGKTVKSWRAYFHANGGSSALHINGSADPALTTKVRALFEPKLKEKDSGLQEILGEARISALGGNAESPLFLDAKEGFMFGDDVEGTWSSPAKSRGTHGHAPDRQALRSSLLLVGPGVKLGDVGIVKMTTIAPTLARFLGVTLAPEADAPLPIF